MRFACSAILFDLDGVLVHSVDDARRSWQDWSRKYGLDPDVVVAASHGRRTVDVIRAVAPGLDAARAAADLEIEAARAPGVIRAGPGALDLLAGLDAGEWAVVTSCTRVLALARLRASGLPEPRVLVAGDDVVDGKPDPAGYLRAAAQLGHEPARCVVIEDASAGVVAARRAGMRVIGLTNGGAVDPVTAADVVVGSCAELAIVRSASLTALTARRP